MRQWRTSPLATFTRRSQRSRKGFNMHPAKESPLHCPACIPGTPMVLFRRAAKEETKTLDVAEKLFPIRHVTFAGASWCTVILLNHASDLQASCRPLGKSGKSTKSGTHYHAFLPNRLRPLGSQPTLRCRNNHIHIYNRCIRVYMYMYVYMYIYIYWSRGLGTFTGHPCIKNLSSSDHCSCQQWEQ